MIKVQFIESVKDILVSHEGEHFSITWDSANGFQLEQLKTEMPETHIVIGDGTPEHKQIKENPLKAPETPIVARTPSLAIRQGPMDDILKLENVNADSIAPILRKWYPSVSERSLSISYTYLYLRFLRNENYIDDDGRILKKSATKEKKPTTEKEEKPAIIELKKELEIAIEKPIEDAKVKESKNPADSPVVESTPSLAIRQGPIDDILKLTIANIGTTFPVLRMWYPNTSESTLKDYIYRYLRYLRGENYIDDEGHILKKLGKDTEVEDEGPDLFHPVRDDLAVVTIKGKVEIYLEPLNEILKFERIDDMRLHKILVKYYDVPRVSFMTAIKGTWMEFLKEQEYIDDKGKPTCKEVQL